MNLPVAVLIAIVGAFTFGASDVLEQRATHRVAKRPPLDLKLFADLAVNRLWLIGITVDIIASVMQAFALHFGPLALVQPILVLDLLFAVVIASVLARSRPDWVVSGGVLCCTGGLVLFLAVARPQSPAVSVSPTILVPLGVGVVFVIVLCLVAWRISPRRFLPLATAFACGAIFGVTAFLLKEITQTIGHGFNPPTQQWPLYAFIIAEPLGFLLNQNAFQESSLIAPVLAIRTVTDPLVAIGIGLVWLHERVASSGAAITAEVAGLIIMSAGVVALAYRSPHVAAGASRDALKGERNDPAQEK
ncbi:MAG TPA: DMT family transporter [Streptosporangiaceae bacterium]|jgi:drug/metabolite transporter (DMT)-like permease